MYVCAGGSGGNSGVDTHFVSPNVDFSLGGGHPGGKPRTSLEVAASAGVKGVGA